MEEGNFTERLEDPPGIKRCLDEGVQGPRIEHYSLRSSSSQWVQRWVEHQPQDISTATAEVGPSTLAQNVGPHTASEQQTQTKQTMKETCGGQKPKVRWPGASEVKERDCINVDLKEQYVTQYDSKRLK